jgi:uncharacterized protein YecE (DUF72 family)
MRGNLFVGTSGFAYKEWKPEFYPADLKPADMLSFYSRRFNSVEINNTFYKMPTEKVLAQWREQTPEDFSFTLKAPQRITHFARLKNVDETLDFFLRTSRDAMGARLGMILFQCPPNLRYDKDLLDSFLALLPGQPFRFAMEFRHDSWTDAQEQLANNNVAWCVADTDEKKAPLVQTSEAFIYLRAAETRGVLDKGGDAYVYFKHEDDPSGVRYGLRFRQLLQMSSEAATEAADDNSTPGPSPPPPSSSEQPSSEQPSSSPASPTAPQTLSEPR